MASNLTEPREVRRFGLVALLFFGSLCGLAVWREKTFLIGFFGGLALVGCVLFLFPVRARPVYRGWLKVAHGIGRGVTLVMLTLAYFLVITPSAWIKRIFGGRPLPLKPDRQAASYWVERTEPAQPRERFLKRF